MITDVIVELKQPVKEEFFHMDTVLPSQYYGYGTPLIRCKDCKYYFDKEWVVGGGSYTTCWYQIIANAHPNDFCSRAERRDE